MHPLLRRAVLLITMAAQGSQLSGCATEDFARRTGRGGIVGLSEGLGALNDPLLRRLREALLRDEGLQQEARALARAVTAGVREGALAGFPDGGLVIGADLSAATEALVGHAVSAALRALQTEAGPTGQQLQQVIAGLRPEVAALVRAAVLATGESLRQTTDHDLQFAVRQLTSAATEGALSGIEQGLRGPLGADLERVLSENVARGVSKVAHDAGEQAVAGVADGLKKHLPAYLQQSADRAQNLLWILVLTFGAIAALLGVGCVLLYRQYRQSIRTLAVVAGRINAHHDPALKKAIQEHATRTHVQGWLQDFLHEHGL